MKSTLTLLFALLTGAVSAVAGDGRSVYTTQLDDAAAIHLTGAVGDGLADDTDALQAAIDKANAEQRGGVVLVPEGRYRITRTIHLPPAVRVIGWGAKRPVFVLPDHTPGYSSRERAGLHQVCRRQPRHIFLGDE
jgi:hypothetical protein